MTVVKEGTAMSRRGENIYHRKDGLWEARYSKGVDEKKTIRGRLA